MFSVKLKAILSLYFILGALKAQSQQILNIQEAIESALNNNLQIKQLQLSEKLSSANLKQSKMALLPSINAGTNYNFNFGRTVDPFSYQFVNERINSTNGNVSLVVPIFQGFQLINQIAQNKSNLEADKSNVKKLQYSLTLTVVTTYLQILSYQDVLKASKDQLERAKQQYDIEQRKYRVGSKTVADLSQAKAQIANSELNVVNSQNQLDIAFINLAQLIEWEPSKHFDVVKPIVDELADFQTERTATEIYATAVNVFPDIQLNKYKTLAAESAVKVAKGGLYPRFSFQGNIGTGYSSTGERVLLVGNTFVNDKAPFTYQINKNLNQTLGFSLSIPIINAYSAKTLVEQAKINLESAKYDEQIGRENFKKIIYQAVIDLKTAISRLEYTKLAFESSKDAMVTIQKRYDLGLLNSFEFNQSQDNLNKAQFDVIQARYDLIFKRKVIDFYIGKPIIF